MATNAVKECGICNEEFDENLRCPRMLPCTHCICTNCITELINRQNLKCPFCVRKFTAKSAQKLGINTTALDLLKYIKYMEAESRKLLLNMSLEELVEAKKKNSYEVNCENIRDLKKERDRIIMVIKINEDLKRNILMNHMTLKENITKRIKDLESKCLLEVEFLEFENKRLKNWLNELEKGNKKLESVKQGLDNAKTIIMADSAIRNAEESNAALQIWLEDRRLEMSIEDKIQQSIEKECENMKDKINSIKLILDSPGKKEIDIKGQREAIILLEKIAEEITNLSPAMKYLASLDGIYATDDTEGKIRSAKITFSRNKMMWLHCFNEEEMPPHVCTVKHRDVINLADHSSKSTFVDFGTSESRVGRIVIRLTPDTKRAQNFSLLCSGELGPSFLNTRVYEVWRKGNAGESVACGAYDRNDDRGRQVLVVGAGLEEGGILKQPDKAGAVSGSIYGDEWASRFWITTKDNPGKSNNTVFGQVESGLHYLREAISNHPNIRNERIINCGIVLTL